MWNDKETDNDLLGHYRIAKTIGGLINNDSLSPLTIGVYGDWGAGKSSVLKLVKKELKEVNADRVECLTFNGWLFQGFDDAKTTLMTAIISELRRSQPKNEKLKRKAKSLLRRIDWLKLARHTAGIAFTGMTGVPDAAMLSGLLDKLQGALSAPGSVLTGDQLRALGGALQETLKEADANTIPEEILEFRKEFEDLLTTARIDRLVVLVDDLDRCLPETAIEVLEAMRFFVFVPGTTFVLAADEKMIAYAVSRHFSDLPVGVGQADYTRNYLEKLIQIPFRIPSLGKTETRVFVTLLLAQLALGGDTPTFEKCCNSASKLLSQPWKNARIGPEILASVSGGATQDLRDAVSLAQRISDVLAEGLSGNPRQIKRFLNTLRVRIAIAEAHEIADAVRTDELAKLMLLERFQDKIYRDLGSEAAKSADGTVENLRAFEESVRQPKTGGKSKGKKPKTVDFPTEWSDDEWLVAWARIEPPLGSVDLRPYYFVSREKTPGFTATSGLDASLDELAGRLAAGNRLAIAGLSAEIKALDSTNARNVFEYLTDRAERAQDWKVKPKEFDGILAICKEHVDLQHELVRILGDLSVGDLGPWVAVGVRTALTIPESQKSYDELIHKWQQQGENKSLQKAAGSMGGV